MVTLNTERLLVREFREEDWPAVHEYAADPEVVRYLSWGPNTEKQTHEFIARAIAHRREEPRRRYWLAVTLKADARLIGSVGLAVRRPEDREAELGYCFHRDCWGKGCATEASRAVLSLGFRQADVHRIFATCNVRNVASARVLEKIGMQREGHLREHKWQKGQWRDSFVYAILEDEWACPGSSTTQSQSRGQQ